MNDEWKKFKDDLEIGGLIKRHESLGKSIAARRFPMDSQRAQVMLSKDAQDKLRDDEKELHKIEHSINEKIVQKIESEKKKSSESWRWAIATTLAALSFLFGVYQWQQKQKNDETIKKIESEKVQLIQDIQTEKSKVSSCQSEMALCKQSLEEKKAIPRKKKKK